MPYLAGARRIGRFGLVPMVIGGGSVSRFPLSRGGPIFVRPPLVPGFPGTPAAPVSPGPMPEAPLPPGQPAAPTTPPSSANAGTPVPAGYPTSQIFVDPNGGFWEYSTSQNQWINVGTPYNTGATALPPSSPSASLCPTVNNPTPPAGFQWQSTANDVNGCPVNWQLVPIPGAPTSAGAPTTAPAPANISVTSTPSDTYSAVLTWLQGDDLGTTIGFPSIPNWIIVAAAAALAWKFTQGGKRRNPSRLRAHRRRRAR
jgi:hypothetical protein